MNHEMNTLAIGRQEAFSTMVSNKVPATAHCLSDGIHKAKESCGEQKGWGRQGIVGKEGREEKPGGKHKDLTVFGKRAIRRFVSGHLSCFVGGEHYWVPC